MNLYRNKKQNKNSGFTLIEMIVVLVVLGILASVAVYSIISYINMTRFNNNQENATSIFQSAQSSLNHMSETGTIEKWAETILGEKGLSGIGAEGIGIPDEYDSTNYVVGGPIDNIYNQGYFEAFPDSIASSQSGQSAHMRYAVTYTPDNPPYPSTPSENSLLTQSQKNQNKIITDLIGSDLSSTELFKGIITIEFDIEKAVDTNGNLRLSASVFSVFYDSKRTSWDSTAFNGALIVPYRDYEYRRTTSFIGYASGKSGSSAVDSVFIPSDAEIKNILFTLRNGETLELTWSAKTDSTPVTGNPDHIHYVFSLYDADADSTDQLNGTNKFCDLVVNESSILGGIPQSDLTNQDSFYDELQFSKTEFVEGKTSTTPITRDNGTRNYTVVYTSEKITNEKGIPITIYRASITDTAKVYVHEGNGAFNYNNEFNNASNASKYYYFPLTVSYEIYDVYGTTISERISYSLTLDAMMSRNLIKYVTSKNSTTEREFNYSINRLLFKEDKLVTNSLPMNFYATMKAENDNFGDLHTEYNGDTLAPSDIIYAERALDDPVYLQNDGTDGNEVYYSYFANAARQESTVEYAIVNSYFGDLEKGSFGRKPNLDPSKDEGYSTVTITSFRHLYNIRMLASNSTKVCYTILRDLNWYYSYENAGTKYASEVIVYSPVNGGTGLKAFSPVPVPDPSTDPSVSSQYYGRVLNVVSFPSISELTSNSKLVADNNTISRLGADEDKTSSINNLQMRMSSFFSADLGGGIETKLSGYGLINVNSGTIVNIRANGWTIILDNTPNGASDDSTEIGTGITSFISGTVKTKELGENDFLRSSPLGGLVGANNGIIGSDKEPDAEKNTIRFSNCIVSSMFKNNEGKWEIYKVSACAGIIGDNNKKVYGHIEACGHFASVGWRDVSAVIGFSQTNVDALLLVDNTFNKEKAIVEFKDDSTDASSVILATADCVGGALGFLKDNLALCQNSDGIISTGPTQTAELVSTEVVASGAEAGRLSITEKSDLFYAVDITLDEKSYILMRTNDSSIEERPGGIGGAVGRINAYNGELLSIHVDNSGVIASTEGYKYSNNNLIERHLGGAIGILNGGTISNVYISVINHSDIGTLNGTSDEVSPSGQCRSTGGAIGRISNLNNANGRVTISVVNEKGIYGNPSQSIDHSGVGGAVGSITGGNDNASNMPKYFILVENNGQILNSSSTTDKSIGTGGCIGCIKTLPRGSAIYCIMNDGALIKTAGNNAGGIIGIQTSDVSSCNETAVTSLTVDLIGTSITAAHNNAGGAIGYSNKFDSYTTILTRISGTISINASSNAGGISGKMNSGTTTNSALIMQSAQASSVLNIKAITSGALTPALGNDNAGGIIGYLIGKNAFIADISLPEKSGDNSALINIDCYDNAGGVFGQVEFKDHDFGSDSSSINFYLQPGTHIKAVHNNAGGIIGLLNAAKYFKTDLTVSADPSLTSAAYITAGDSYAGGIIGSSTNAMTLTSALTMKSSSPLSTFTDTSKLFTISSVSYVGGCIGSIQGNAKVEGSIILNGNHVRITGTNSIGGIIGSSSNMSLSGTIKSECNNLSLTGIGDYIGGCIGYMEYVAVNESGTISYSGKEGVITGQSYIGGCIGNYTGNKDTIKVAGSVILNSDHMIISGTNRIGGVIGSSSNMYVSGNIKSLSDNVSILGTSDYVGGCIGRMENGALHSSGSIIYSGKEAVIIGNSNTGGCIGMATNIGNILGYIEYAGSNASITGNNECTGGIIGAVSNCKISNQFTTQTSTGTITETSNAEIVFSGEYASISGKDYLGGIIGGYNQGSINYHTTLTFSGNSPTISGQNNVGGLIGSFTGASINGTAELTYKPVSVPNTEGTKILSCSIIGTGNNVGGVIGQFTGGSINGASKLSNESSGIDNYPSTINGTGNNIGGVIGYFSGSYIKGTTSLIFQVKGTISSPSGITGTGDNVGGIFGEVLSGKSESNTKYTYTGQYTYIKGQNNVGGIIGISDTYHNGGTIRFAPLSDCKITGNNEVGGIAGLGSSRTDNGNLHTKPTVFLDGCNLEIKASGFVGGIIGSSTDYCYYSGGTIEAKNNSELNIISTTSAAGGNIGSMIDGNMGDASTVSITCHDTSRINVTGYTAAGGCIGIVMVDSDLKTSFRKNTFDINIKLTNANSELNVIATGNGAGAGGIIGINYQTFGRQKDGTTGLTSGNGKFTVKATGTSGYAGAIIGINHGTLKANTNRIYKINITTLKDSRTLSNPSATTAPEGYRKPGEDWLIGLRDTGSSDSSYKFSINGNPEYTM
jgi:prepilin-type N-terminal cleavage/methylation domain-containing protein